MLVPKKVKHRKWQKGRGRFKELVASRATDVVFGQFGLKAVSERWVSSKQIEAARRAVTHFVKRGGKIWIRIFPDKPVTRKGSQSTMGTGKGSPEFYVAVVKPGTVIMEIAGISEEAAREALRLAGDKLPVRTKFLTKH
ncbi:50S ribosomal protein L16 [Candidatus Falkowbacteria bacterium]|nr:50S ribosomal protein L16 [Candidatus Falkowbacteria bacterium]